MLSFYVVLDSVCVLHTHTHTFSFSFHKKGYEIVRTLDDMWEESARHTHTHSEWKLRLYGN